MTTINNTAEKIDTFIPGSSGSGNGTTGYPEGTIGSLMDKTMATLKPDHTVAQTIEELSKIVRDNVFTYGFVLDTNQKLVGVIVMRDLLFADKQTRLQDIMIKSPFWLTPMTTVMDAMRQVVTRHFPEYPVCEEDGKFLGTVRGYRIFESQAIEISAQAGTMVGVEKEERLGTPWTKSLKSRHPWLQLNLLTAFVAGAVVSIFQNTIDQMVILAVFLPVLAGQSGNTGCQALAVTLRGMTLGDLVPGREKSLVAKEALLGILNGTFVGVSAGLGMYILAHVQHNPMAMTLSIIVFMAMIGSCMVSGIAGALIPLILKRLGADPATASSIFLTTMTDVASMGLLLGLATWLAL